MHGSNLDRSIGYPDDFVVSQSLQANIGTVPLPTTASFQILSNSPVILSFDAVLA
jgi:hypothetical protein